MQQTASHADVQDPITAVAAAPHFLLLGRKSGAVMAYSLPDVALRGTSACCEMNLP